MKFLSNAHTHTTYCDGRSDIQTLVSKAQALGFVSLGFSEHGYQDFDPDYSMSAETQQAYLAELRVAAGSAQRAGNHAEALCRNGAGFA